MTTSDLELKDVSKVKSFYTNEDQITSLRQRLNFYVSSDDEEVILEACSSVERANMDASEDSHIPSFYFYLPNIREIVVRLPLIFLWGGSS